MTNVLPPADQEQVISHQPCDEIDLILACVRESIHTAHRGTIEDILRKELNWDSLYRQAEKFGLIPIVYFTLHKISPEQVPGPILCRMKEIYLGSMTRSMIQTRDLLQIIQCCREHEIPVIPYKGVVLSQQIYGDIGLRISSDIDIIVRRQDVVRTKALLLSQGYTTSLSLTPAQDEKFLKVHSEHHFGHSCKTMVDIHWQFISGYYLDPFEEDRIWSGLKGVFLEGQDIATLSTEMLIISLCIHGAKHQWKNTDMICDLAGVIASGKDINWELVFSTAREKRIERILFLGLWLAEVVMKTEFPQGVSDAIRRDRGMHHWISSCIAAMFREDPMPEDDIRFVMYWVSIRECIWDKLRVIASLAFIPDHKDWAYISLPGILAPFYSVVRPIRLVFEYGVKG